MVRLIFFIAVVFTSKKPPCEEAESAPRAGKTFDIFRKFR